MPRLCGGCPERRVVSLGAFGRCLTKQVDFDSGLAYVLQQWILFYQLSTFQLYGALRTHEPDSMFPSCKIAI